MPKAYLNETELYYLTKGQGIPCLVMHGGLSFDHTYFNPWLSHIYDIFQFILYDHRGNGRSGRQPLKTLTFSQSAVDADVLRSQLGIKKVAVPSHSTVFLL